MFQYLCLWVLSSVLYAYSQGICCQRNAVFFFSFVFHVLFQTFLFSQKENYFPSGVLLFWLFIVKETQKRFHSIYNWWVFFKVLAWIVHSLNMLEILLSFIFKIGCQVFKWLANCDRFRISLSTKQYIFGWSWC